MVTNKPLLDSQLRFVEEYVVDLNGAQAAIRAGYAEGSAKESACRLLSDPRIAAAVKKLLDERSARTGITADKVLRELAAIGFSNIADYANWSGSSVDVIDSAVISEEAKKCIIEVSQTSTPSGRNIKVKLHDKVAALEKIGRHLGMFNDKLQVSGDKDNPLQVDSKIEIVLVKANHPQEKE